MFDIKTVNSIISELSSITDNEDGELMWHVVDLIKEKANFYFASLYLVDSNKEFAVMKSGTVPYGKKLVERGHKLLIRGNVLTQTSIVRAINLNSVCLFDYFGPEIIHTSPFLPETLWELALPTRRNDEVIGVLEVEGNERASFRLEDTLEFQKVVDKVSELLVKFDLI